MKRIAGLLLVTSAVVASQNVWPHARSESYSDWRINGDAMTGVVTVSAGEVTSLVTSDDTRPLDALFAEHLAATVAVSSAIGDCAPSPPTSLAAARGFMRVELEFRCDGGQPSELRYRALFDQLPAHVHYARIFEHDALIAEALITERADGWSRKAGSRDDRHGFLPFLDLGIRHILSGLDHIAFLVGMLLVAGSVGRSVAAVTGFTLGHSVSLGAAVLGYLHADGRLVEAFIGFTVALVAVEYFLMRRPNATSLAAIATLTAWVTGGFAVALDLISIGALAAYVGFGVFAFCYLLASSRIPASGNRLAGWVLFTVTTCFGLIHGFGFAGFLMETGIVGGSLALPLLGFNVGVEVGQLALLALVFVAVYFLRGTRAALLAPLAAAALCGIGVFWFVGRSLAV